MNNNFDENDAHNETAKDPEIDAVNESQNDNNDEDSDIEIGCKECDKYREKIQKVNVELDKKIKHIYQLEKKIDDEKYGFDSTTYNQYLQKRLNDTLEETNRHFENYVQIRNAHHDLLEQRAKKKRGKKISNDSDLLTLKKSLK